MLQPENVLEPMGSSAGHPGPSGSHTHGDTLQGRGDDGNDAQGEAGGGNPHPNNG